MAKSKPAPVDFKRRKAKVGRVLAPLAETQGEQSLPVIASTADGGHAMGAWSPDRSRSSGQPATYGRFWFEQERVAKWNCVVREKADAAGGAAASSEGDDAGRLPPGEYRYLVWVAVGTREQVRDTLAQLVGCRQREHRVHILLLRGTTTVPPVEHLDLRVEIRRAFVVLHVAKVVGLAELGISGHLARRAAGFDAREARVELRSNAQRKREGLRAQLPR